MSGLNQKDRVKVIAHEKDQVVLPKITIKTLSRNEEKNLRLETLSLKEIKITHRKIKALKVVTGNKAKKRRLSQGA